MLPSLQFGTVYRLTLPQALDEPTLNRERIATARSQDGVVMLYRDGQNLVLSTHPEPGLGQDTLEKDASLAKTLLGDGRRTLPMTRRVAEKVLAVIQKKIDSLKTPLGTQNSAQSEHRITPDMVSFYDHSRTERVAVQPLSRQPVSQLNRMVKEWMTAGVSLGDYTLDLDMTHADQPHRAKGTSYEAFLEANLGTPTSKPQLYLYFKNQKNPMEAASIFYSLRPVQGGLYQEAVFEVRTFTNAPQGQPQTSGIKFPLLHQVRSATQ